MKWKLEHSGDVDPKKVKEELEAFTRDLAPVQNAEVPSDEPNAEEERVFRERYPNPKEAVGSAAIDAIEKLYKRSGGIKNQDYVILGEGEDRIFLGNPMMGNR